MAQAGRGGWPQRDAVAMRARSCRRLAPARRAHGPPPAPRWRTRTARLALVAGSLVLMARASKVKQKGN